MNEPKILIIDLGSQYTLVIGRTLRELGYRSAILSPKQAAVWLTNNRPKGIILSGGPASVNDADAPAPPGQILNRNIPILGICYGMQWLAKESGGKIIAAVENKDYGSAQVTLDISDPLFADMVPLQTVWMSHGDSVAFDGLGSRYFPIGRATQGNCSSAALRFRGTPWWGVQFHPEVVETPCGKQMLENFVGGICRAKRDWQPQSVIEEIRQQAAAYGKIKVLGGFSGGVDSSTLSAILAPVMGSNLQAICIDGGQLRQDELNEIVRHAQACGVFLKIVKAEDRFLTALDGLTDAAKKRIAFRMVYKAILKEESALFDLSGEEIVLQGSLATDFIESGQHSGSGSAEIKQHHNTELGFKRELHPFKNLFKYEVRALARALGLPDSIALRQPFPGPGLFLRVNGVPVTRERLELVRWADAEVTRILREAGLWSEISQLVVALNGVPTVGVKGDGRIYAGSIVVRGVQTSDFMTATGYQIPAEVRRRISREITKHPQVVRVFFDETDKPPATTEME
ncbi:MAG: glutamine-hydrolyzing GMP synthase [Candidatus Vogelbacteria bacterium]|nr:glutamine-hydrolyzing GMP synthase [Candidatus Vogelbacteria bacterium]